MTQKLTTVLFTLMVALFATAVVADEGRVMQSHNLTVTEKLQLMETIEVTSEKEIDSENLGSPDLVVDSILDEIAQLESSSASSK